MRNQSPPDSLPLMLKRNFHVNKISCKKRGGGEPGDGASSPLNGFTMQLVTVLEHVVHMQLVNYNYHSTSVC